MTEADFYYAAFGMNDIYVSLKTFMKLSGDRGAANKQIGQLQTQVRWEVVKESCQFCASGMFGKDPNGNEDTCTGKDVFGLERCGRKKGAERALTTEAVDAVCNYEYKCPVAIDSNSS